VHHTNEIAQSESATGMPYVNYWMHNNHLLDTTGKMSKSNDDFLTLSSLIEKGYNPLAYRYFLMTAVYRKELQFSFEALDGAVSAYQKLIDFCTSHATKEGKLHDGYMQEFKSALFDDLNTARALAVMWNMLKDIDVSYDDKYRTLMAFDSVFGFGLDAVKKVDVVISEEMQALLDARAQARASKNFAESDRIRAEIEKHGFTVKDTSDGQKLEK
jgi:cysteinyl-tRNA synthetase